MRFKIIAKPNGKICYRTLVKKKVYYFIFFTKLQILPTADAEPSTADPEEEDIIDPGKRDLIQFAFYYEKAGIGFSKTELYCLEISIRELAKTEKLQDVRFWGKIFGLEKNYIVVESEISEEEMEARVAVRNEFVFKRSYVTISIINSGSPRSR